MKRFTLALMLILLISCAAAEAAMLPVDVETFTPVPNEQGETCLEWNGPVLPAGTAYELIETVTTDSTCNLESVQEDITHRFARISYLDASGQGQEAWVMAHNLNRAQRTPLNTEQAAQAYAMRFFTNQYVKAWDESCAIRPTETAEGWRMERISAEGAVTHELIVDKSGQVIQYRDLACQPADLSRGCVHSNVLADQADSYAAHGVLEWSSRELLPDVGYNSVATIDRTGDVFTFIIDGFDYYVALEVEPSVRMVAYGDMRLGASYGDYLSRDEARELAKLALLRECSLPEEAELSLFYANFCAKPYEWTNAYVPLPYWQFQFDAITAGEVSHYQVLIDAQNGALLEISDPSLMGNG